MHMNNRRGVTLIELLIAMSVLGIVLIPVLGILGFATRQFGSQTSRAQTILLANKTLNAVCKDVGNSISVQADSNGVLSVFTLPGNTDTAGNYIPVAQNGSLVYVPGLQIHYYLCDATGKNNSGHTQPSKATNLWREYWQTGGLLGLGSSWVTDTAWSQQGGNAGTRYPNMSTMSFTTTGLPANTIRVSLTMTDKEGGQTSSYTVTRSVYLSNHN